MNCSSCTHWKPPIGSERSGECRRAESVHYKPTDPTSTAWADGSDGYAGVLNTLPTHSCSMYAGAPHAKGEI